VGARVLFAGGGTGGHLYPALNLAAAVRRADPGARIVLLGARRGVEARVLPESEWEHRLLPMEPLRRSRPWRNWRLLAAAPAVATGLAGVFRELDPELVVGTGGYASGPALAWALAGRRATAIQEQNAFPGLVTRLLAPRVDQVHLGWPEAADRIHAGRSTRVRTHGNPVARPTSAAGPSDGLFPPGRVVGVIGGSQGARGLNERLLADLEATTDLPPDTSLLWIAGPAHRDAVAIRVARLPFAGRIRVVGYVDDLGSRLERLSLAVCRAGAMFCAELAAAGVPAVLVPLPTAAADHQRYNAAALERAGAAIVVEETTVRRTELWGAVAELLREERRLLDMASAMRSRGRPEAADRIAADLLDLVAQVRAGGGQP
jgi:UDP-N-acetylglucosamine--N-acetylmuramyl-(pentapeptide) pyrophosphoryl-undecaprenol N-acetylglucosamine transferase